MGEVTNIFEVTKIIAANCARRQQTVTEQCLPDGQVHTFNLVSRANLVHSLFLICLLYSLHVSANMCPSLEEIKCIYATPGICHSVRMSVWYSGHNALRTRQTCRE
jgi:hypothetical protein